MTTNQEMFLYAAEELNFTRAARRAFVTQQCLSDHIKRLETQLNTKLFDRTPKLALTQAGQTLYLSLLKIKKIEEQTMESIADDSMNIHGRITMGIQADRSHVLFPILYPVYHDMYPNVKISLISGHTYNFLEMLDKGQIDLMIGHDATPAVNRTKESIFAEPVYLMATERILETYIPDWTSDRVFVEPAEISLLPLSCASYSCTIMDHMTRFFTENNVTVNYLCAVGDYLTQLNLCKGNETAFFCPESYLLHKDFIESQSQAMEPEHRIIAMPIHHMDSKIHVEIVYNSEVTMPKYMRDFKDLLIREYRDKVESLKVSCSL